jgi:hypothetical protein
MNTPMSFEEGVTHAHSDFAIDTAFSGQGEILETLTERDARQIGTSVAL